MSGFLALLDDVAAIAKIAAASVDDISANAAKAGSKTVGVLIDDAAVTPNYVVGITAARELPMIGKIAMGSLRNKALLIPVLLALDYFLPIAITALLMIGGAYLCFEGAEKSGTNCFRVKSIMKMEHKRIRTQLHLKKNALQAQSRPISFFLQKS